MKKATALLLVFMLLLSGCSGGASGGKDGKKNKEYRMLYTSEPSLNYLKGWGTDSTCLTIDGLVEFNTYDVVVPCMATSWTKSDDSLTYTFKLRKGVKWYTNKGEAYSDVVADDFIAGMKYILTADNAAGTANLVYDYVVNAKEYYDGKITDFSQVGIKAIDKYTLQYTLKDPVPYFVRLVSYNPYLPVNSKFLEEVGDQFATTAETLLYNGAYIMTQKLPEDKTIYELNKNYWNKDAMSISKITLIYNKEGNSIGGEMFQRGEIDQTGILPELKEEWINDVNGKGAWAVRTPKSPNSWFFGFNFEPTYEGNNVEDWKVAVNNRNFRKSIYHGFDKIAVCLTMELWQPEDRKINTITPPSLFTYKGVDYTKMGALKEITESETFDSAKALEYKKKAMAELDGKVKFPIQIVMPYSTGDKSETNIVQVIEQQLEKTLGKDYVDVVLVPYPPTNFNTATRNSGKFSIMEMRWGADYADPATYTDIFSPNLPIGKKYNRPYLSTEYMDANGKHEYVKLLEAALSEKIDIEKRWNMLAEAEAFLINEALVIPTFQSGGGWWLCRLDPFSGFNTQFGRDEDILKGKVILDKPMTREEYDKALEKFLKEREEAQKNATNQN